MAAIATAFTTHTPTPEIDYPTSDGKPMGETDLHRSVMVVTIETLKMHYAGQQVYVSGNLLLYYRPGNKRRHVSPDVLVIRGLEPRDRENYLLWEEGRAPNVVIEVTSQSTRDEDLEDKLEIYRDEIEVAEYFLFDPRSEYLNPALQGYRLSRGRYEPIEPVGGRLAECGTGAAVGVRWQPVAVLRSGRPALVADAAGSPSGSPRRFGAGRGRPATATGDPTTEGGRFATIRNGSSSGGGRGGATAAGIGRLAGAEVA